MTATNNSNPGLYLALDAGEGATARLAAARAVAPVQAMLVRMLGRLREDDRGLRSLVAEAQRQGIAALVQDDWELARSCGADGVHLSWSADVEARLREARLVLGKSAIVGCMAGLARHDAMILGEAGADYIGFGEAQMSADDRLEMVRWWAEIFEVPCVAFGVAGRTEAVELAAAGADFVAIALDARQTAAEVKEMLSAVAGISGNVAGQVELPLGGRR